MVRKFKNGIALTEIVLGVSVLALMLVFITHTITLFLNAGSVALEQTRALYLAEEGQEMLRYIRDSDWNYLDSLTEGGTYYFSVSTTTIATSSSPEIVEGVYTRSFVVNELERDVNDDFVESGGTADEDGRVVTVTVTWGGATVSLDSILTNIFNI